jgi:hypothetical protein
MYGVENPGPACLSVSFRHHAADCDFLTTYDERLPFGSSGHPGLCDVVVRGITVQSTETEILNFLSYSHDGCCVDSLHVYNASFCIKFLASARWDSFRYSIRWGQNFAFAARLTNAKSTEHCTIMVLAELEPSNIGLTVHTLHFRPLTLFSQLESCLPQDQRQLLKPEMDQEYRANNG